MEWHLDKTQLVESTQTSLVLKSGHFQVSDGSRPAFSMLSLRYPLIQRKMQLRLSELTAGVLSAGCQPRLIPACPWPFPASTQFPGQLSAPASPAEGEPCSHHRASHKPAPAVPESQQVTLPLCCANQPKHISLQATA